MELLIDFESPKNVTSPLIPCPRTTESCAGDNPFDIVFAQLAHPPDPFTPIKSCNVQSGNPTNMQQLISFEKFVQDESPVFVDVKEDLKNTTSKNYQKR